MKRLPLAVWAAAGGTLAVLMAVSTRYGWHRDELYFLRCGRDLAWGYVDQPPLVPALARLSETLFGTSLAALRLWPALAVAAVVVMAALMARDFGGGPFAQGVAAVAAAVCPLFLGAGHLLATATFDLCFWTAITLLVVRLLRSGDQRLWLAIGVVAGVGLLNKHSVVFLLVGLAVGLLLTHERRQLRSPWLWAGAVAALVIWAPNVMWHAQRDWPVFEMLESLSEEGGTEARVLFVPSQVFVLGTLAVLWIPGVLWLLGDDRGRAWRPLAIAYLGLVVLFTVTGGKPYYLAGIYPVLLAAGAVHWQGRPTRRRATAIAVVGAVAAIPLALPLVPVDWARHHPIEDLETEFGSQLGWRDVAEQVAALRPSGPINVFTGDYGAAAAVDLWGPDLGLPPALSGHNNYWVFGPDHAIDGAPTIVLGLGLPRDLSPWFEGCRLRDRVAKPHGVEAEEAGAPIYLCERPTKPWADLWPDVRHYTA